MMGLLTSEWIGEISHRAETATQKEISEISMICCSFNIVWKLHNLGIRTEGDSEDIQIQFAALANAVSAASDSAIAQSATNAL